MKASDFRGWLEKYRSLVEVKKSRSGIALGEVAPQAAVVKWLEDSFGPNCLACQADHPYRWGRAALSLLRVQAPFTVVPGTSLIRLRHNEQWLNYSAALIEGLTVRASAKQCGIDKNTSSRWCHWFLALPVATKANHLQGFVEADETFFSSS